MTMKNIHQILLACLLLLIFVHPVNGQNTSNNEKLRKARLLLSEYSDASHFKDMNTGGFDPSWEGIFRNCFDTNSRRIVFDVPFRIQQENISQESLVIEKYLDIVAIDEYTEIIRNACDLYHITDFDYKLIETGFDTTKLSSSNKMQFGIRKTFSNTNWSLSDVVNYIIEIRFIGDQPKITAIRQKDENLARSNVSLTFINSTIKQINQEYKLTDIVSEISIEFDENVNNRKLVAGTNASGKIELGLIPNSATIKIDTVFDFSGTKYMVPPDWKVDGKKVNTKPVQGFEVKIQSSEWNGFSWSFRGFGGMISQSENQLKNFSTDSDFSNNTGFKYGFGVEMVKHFSLSQLINIFDNSPKKADPLKRTSRQNTYLGVGMGVSYYQYQYRISSEAFVQNPYDYTDRLGEPVDILVSVAEYHETTSGNGIILPIFTEVRKVLTSNSKYLQALSFQAGLNIIFPLETNYNISGKFSRHGLYNQYNPKPITDDAFYNYYSQSGKEIDENFQENPISTALMFRLNGYFDLFGKKSDNLLDIGLLVSFPFSNKSSSETDGFYISQGNDEFSSMSNSKNKIYNYFLGLSVGYNFINYRLY
jgi:hypothetical protein